MKKIKEQISIIKLNIKTLLLFEFLFKLLTALIFIPLATNGFYLAMKITGYNYLTAENITNFLLNPITLLLFLIIIIILTLVTLFDFSTIIIIYDASYNKKKLTFIDAIINSFNKWKKIVKFKNILLAFQVLVLMPLINIGVSSNVISTIKIPEFITDYIYNNIVLSILVAICYLVLVIIFMKWLYTIHYMVLEGKSYVNAVKASVKLSKKNTFKDFIKIVFYQIIIYLVFIAFVLFGILVIYLLNKLLVSIKVVESIFITAVWVFMVIVTIALVMISNSISHLIITSFFYDHKIAKNEEIKKLNYTLRNKEKKKRKSFKIILGILSTIAIGLGSYFTYGVISGRISLKIQNARKVEITAHRGGATTRPENTMAAFIHAVDLEADCIELDVQQTKDKKIVVSHDSDLTRVGSVDKDIIDMTYDEISKIDVGSYFDEKYKDERMPLLEDVIQFAIINDIKLNIEIKLTGKEDNFVQDVVDLVNEYDFADRCVVTSLQYNVLETIKKYDSNINTIYVMSVAIGEVTKLKYADGFSVEAANVNDDIVSTVHNAGKELYAWTVNSEESIGLMMESGVDNVITDDVPLAQKLYVESKQSDVITEFIKIISNI